MTDNLDEDTRRYIKSQSIDPDLWSSSDSGFGVMYPHIWDVIKRYILHGSEWYQAGGLSILANTAWQMPLSEAADILEQYFRKHSYHPSIGGRGGIALEPLRAAYAVGTTPGFQADDLTARRSRMVVLLETCADALRDGKGLPPGDAELVLRTAEAIRTSEPGFEPQFGEMLQEGGGPEERMSDSEVPLESEGGGVTRSEVHQVVERAIADLEDRLKPFSLTETERLTIQHGYDLLKQALQYETRRIDQRIDQSVDSQRHRNEDIDKALNQRIDDVHRAIQNLSTNRQMGLARWQLGIEAAAWLTSVILGIAAIFISLYR